MLELGTTPTPLRVKVSRAAPITFGLQFTALAPGRTLQSVALVIDRRDQHETVWTAALSGDTAIWTLTATDTDRSTGTAHLLVDGEIQAAGELVVKE